MDMDELKKYEQITEAEQEMRIGRSVYVAKSIAKLKGQPTCEFDKENKKVYFLYPNGKKVYPSFEEKND